MSGSGRWKLLSMVLWKASHRLCFKHTRCLHGTFKLPPSPFSTYINIVSILFSAYSIGKALNVISLELLPQTKVEPPLGGLKTTQLKMLQSLDVFARISVLAAIGISLRPAADMTVNCQFYLPTLMLLELLVIWTMSKWYLWVAVILCRRFHPFPLCWNICHCQCWWELVPVCLNCFTSNCARWRGEQWNCWWLNPCWYSIHMNPQNPHAMWPVLQLPVLARSLGLSLSSS